MRFLIENYHKLNLTYKIGFAINIGMGIKISSLPNNALPYTGSEKIPLVQSGETRGGSLSSFVNYLSGALLSDSELRALSGNWQNTYTTVTANSANWQNAYTNVLSSSARWNSTYTTVTANSANWNNTYTTFRANSANYAVKNANNSFTVGQTVNGNVSATALTITGGTGTHYILRKFTNSDSFGINNSDLLESVIPSGDFIITLGKDAGSGIGGTGGVSSEIIAIGHDAGKSIGASNTSGSVADVIAIGYNAGNNIGEVNGTTSNIVAIGNAAGNFSGADSVGGVTNLVCIGANAGNNVGYQGTVSDIVAIGQNALNNSATTGGTANYIIGIGNGAGTSIGRNAGSANSVTAIGSNAGSYAGDGGTVTDIIAVGSDAGEYIGAIDTGNNVPGAASDIIAIGNLAGNQAGRGGGDFQGSITNSILIGNQAGYLAGQGGFYDALYAGDGDVNNLIAIGKEAGYQSGIGNTSNNNIFIGLSSGYNKQGSRNTFVGDLTNTSPTSAVNLSGCIAIGYGATPTTRNTIAIGSASTPLSVVPGRSITNSLSGLRIMINGTYYTIPLLA
jgi:hypothetical protein